MQRILRLSKSDISKKELRYVSQVLNKEYFGKKLLESEDLQKLLMD